MHQEPFNIPLPTLILRSDDYFSRNRENTSSGVMIISLEIERRHASSIHRFSAFPQEFVMAMNFRDGHFKPVSQKFSGVMIISLEIERTHHPYIVFVIGHFKPVSQKRYFLSKKPLREKVNSQILRSDDYFSPNREKTCIIHTSFLGISSRIRFS